MRPDEVEQRRRRVFRDRYSVDAELVEVIKGHDSHRFLCNAPAHVVYRYLTRFVVERCAASTGRPEGDLRVLDWGAGKGHTTYFLRKLGVDVTAADVSTESIEPVIAGVVPEHSVLPPGVPGIACPLHYAADMGLSSMIQTKSFLSDEERLTTIPNGRTQQPPCAGAFRS